jgi:hypothetical protein
MTLTVLYLRNQARTTLSTAFVPFAFSASTSPLSLRLFQLLNISGKATPPSLYHRVLAISIIIGEKEFTPPKLEPHRRVFTTPEETHTRKYEVIEEACHQVAVDYRGSFNAGEVNVDCYLSVFVICKLIVGFEGALSCKVNRMIEAGATPTDHFFSELFK